MELWCSKVNPIRSGLFQTANDPGGGGGGGLKVYLHIDTLEANKQKKIPQRGCATPPNVPKLGVSGVKDTATTNKDVGMSCYIQVEYKLF